MYGVDASKKTTKLKKAYFVNASKKTEKLKKCYVVSSDKKLVKLWSGLSQMFFGTTGINDDFFMSEDGSSWELNDTGVSGIISVTYGNGFYYGITTSAVYRSEDCITWTELSSFYAESATLALIRFLNNKVFVISTESPSKIWYSSDSGETWTASSYRVGATTTAGTSPLDFRYGTVNGKTGYYMLLPNGGANYNYYTYIYYWASEAYFAYIASPLNSSGSPMSYTASKGAISISGGTMRIILLSPSGSTYFYTYDGSAFAQVGYKTGKLGSVVGTEDYMICTINSASYKFNSSSIITGGNVGVSVPESTGTFSAAIGNERVATFGYSSGCKVAYSDDYGSSWTVVSPNEEYPVGYGQAMCYSEDGGGYYSE